MMRPSESKDDAKKKHVQPLPLCLFYFPDDSSSVGKITYISTVATKNSEDRRSNRKSRPLGSLRYSGVVKCAIGSTAARQREEVWSRRKNRARIRRRKMKEPMKHLRSYLLTSVKNEKLPEKSIFQSLFEALETVKDAWPSPSSRNVFSLRPEDKKPLENKKPSPKSFKMKNSPSNTQFSTQLLKRRFSMPEELMRKYSVSKERTSEESETNKTMIEITSSSSSIEQEEITSNKEGSEVVGKEALQCSKTKDPKTDGRKAKFPEKVDASQQTREADLEGKTKEAEKEKIIQTEIPKRVTQNEYNSQGGRVIRLKVADKKSEGGVCTCRSERPSSTTASAREETDDSGTTDSIASSSPVQLPKHESSSGNLSSESDYIRCTCAELTSSKDTSTDLFHSGKSTLSQTVSDKSISTQDSTASINSVSTRGSTISDNSNSPTTTPDIERTSAKETTTSPDYSPRNPRNNGNRKNRRREKGISYFQDHKRTCPKFGEARHSKNNLSVNNCRRHCPVHSKYEEVQMKKTISCGTNTEPQTNVTEEKKNTKVAPESDGERQKPDRVGDMQTTMSSQQQTPERSYRWAKLSQKELYLMQQLRHKKFVENQRRFTIPLPSEPDASSMGACGTESAYKESESLEQPIMIPRYSALPRTLSMLVNTSSGDTSIHNSDSDNQSLADSLEDQPTTHVHKLYFDTKKESKPVRGDVNMVEPTKVKHRQPRGRAFFVSIKDPFGEDEMLEKIEKIPQPPEKIKNQIFERHLKICAKHKYLRDTASKVGHHTAHEKKRKSKSVKHEETSQKTSRVRILHQEEPQKILKKKENADKKVKSSKEIGKRKQEDKMRKAETRMEIKSTVKRKREFKEEKGRSKIPVLVSSRSTSSSPERDTDKKVRSPTTGKIRLRREKETKVEGEGGTSRMESLAAVERSEILEITRGGPDQDLSLQKPQAIIHPSQVALEMASLATKDQVSIPSPAPPLKMTAPFPPSWNKQIFLMQMRRSPIVKFRQRFEVIPEEKSSSLSSAEEKATESLPKFVNASTSPLLEKGHKFENIQFQSFKLNDDPKLIFAKIKDNQLDRLPFVKNSETQKIILFSSKETNSNSSKGRDALIAMNRDDFNRLAKGWMNFYKLNENLENSENEEIMKPNKLKESMTENVDKTQNDEKKEDAKIEDGKSRETESASLPLSTKKNDENDKKARKVNETTHCSLSKNEQTLPRGTSNKFYSSNKSNIQATNDDMQLNFAAERKVLQLNEDVRFQSSNTILRSEKSWTSKRDTSLPLLGDAGRGGRAMQAPKTSNTAPKTTKCLDDTDSDSTDYLEPPSPRVPPLPLPDFASDATISSSDSELDDHDSLLANHSMKFSQVKKRGCTSRNRLKKESCFETSRFGKKKNSGWSVTVAGTVELTRATPDLEMRLSFPMKTGPPVVSQSDSGFAEDSNYSKLSDSLQDLRLHKRGKKQPSEPGKWMVTVAKPRQGSLHEQNKLSNNSSRLLPDLESSQTRNAKKVLKDSQPDENVKRIVKKKINAIWPKVQEIIKEEFVTQNESFTWDLNDDINDNICLSVRGIAVSLEKKEKPPTMTERDLTRRCTSRENS